MSVLLTTSARPLVAGARLLIASAGSAGPIDPPPTASNLTLVDVDKDQRVFQRIGTSKHIAVSGTYVGNAPDTIQARIVDATTGAALSQWTTLTAATIADGTFSGLFEAPQGGWYKLQVRDPANPGGITAGTNKWGVGVLVALIGQSNMENFMSTPMNYPVGNPKAVQYRGGTGANQFKDGAFKRVGTTSSTLPPNATKYAPGYANAGEGDRADGPTYLANFLVDALGVPVCLVESAASGQAISVWVDTKAAWNTFVTILNAIGGDCEMAIWLQGESNSAQGTTTTAMVGYLGTLHGQLLTQTGRDAISFHFGIVSQGPASFSSSYAGNSDEKVGWMRAAHVQYANNTPGAFLVTSAHDTRVGDGIHIDGEGFNRLSRRYGKSAAARLGVGVPCAGPRIVSASRVGSVVTVTLQHTGGTALTDGAGGPGSALTGFQFKDAGGNQLTYSASSITGPTVLQFTVSGTPVTVSYAMMNAPHSSDPMVANTAPVLASCVYDNAKYLDGNNAPFGLSAVGAPLQPCPAITITGS